MNTFVTANENDSLTVVFVHGSWGGGWDYKDMQRRLEAQGAVVYRPTLTGLGERQHLNGPDVNLDTHITDIENVIVVEDLENIVLVGHSYGGMVISGVADRIPERISHLVYADAFVPENGESVMDLLPEQQRVWLREHAHSKGNTWDIEPYWPDWGKDVPHPLATYEQPIVLTNKAREKLPTTYILTTEPGKTRDDFDLHALRARKQGWRVIQLQTDHNLQRSAPTEYTHIILSTQQTPHATRR